MQLAPISPTIYQNVAQYIESETNAGKVMALYLSGSQLNHLTSPTTSDFDLFAITFPTKDHLLSNKAYANQIQCEINHVKFDIKIYDLCKAYQVLIKSNFNTVETFMETPEYVCDEQIPFVKTYSQPQMQRELFLLNPRNYVNGIVGYTTHLFKSNKNMTAKDFIMAYKGLYYIDQMILVLDNPASHLDPTKIGSIVLPYKSDLETLDDLYTLQGLKNQEYHLTQTEYHQQIETQLKHVKPTIDLLRQYNLNEDYRQHLQDTIIESIVRFAF